MRDGRTGPAAGARSMRESNQTCRDDGPARYPIVLGLE